MIITEVKTDGLMAQLGEEVIESYDTGSGGKAVSAIIDDLLAFQRKSTKITKGTITASGTRGLSIVNRSILSALLQLQEAVGGYMYVDTNRVLQWPTSIGEDKGQQIRYRKNLVGIERDIDYGGYCTKLHPQSSDESLSDIIKASVLVDKDSDASYGYLTLKETYAAYKDWSGVGNALPGNVEVWEKDSVYWESPFTITGGHDGWGATYAQAYDENEATAGASLITNGGIWCGWLTAGIANNYYDRVKIKISTLNEADVERVEVDIADNTSPEEGDWVNVCDSAGAEGIWLTYYFTSQIVRRVRIRIKPTYQDYCTVYEIYLGTDITDVTSDFVQGTDEHTLRCAIGDYNAGATYYVSYTYADYLIAWDKITDADDIVARVVTNKYEAYAISILEAAILLLDELKEVPITYTIDTLDLSRCEDWSCDFDALQVGSVVQVIDEDLGIDVSVRVIRLEHPDLLYPERMQLQLSTRVKDISDYLADLHKEF